MKQWWLLTLRLILILVPPIEAARWLSNARLATVSVLFTNPDGTACQMPCLLGVRPDSSMYEVLSLLQKHPFTASLRPQGMDYRNFQYSGPGVMVTLNVPYGQQVPPLLLSVDLPRGPSEPGALFKVTLGDVIRIVGEPGAVYPRFHYVWLVYFDGHLLVTARPEAKREDHLDADTPISSVVLRAQPLSPVGPSSRWRGFRTIQRYEIDSKVSP